ncbi:hypothetical protein DPMN_171780 [Dreissena polymorpha]|uniref:PH domain-containing protein n=1 Tax=Dreissena polymorpha TaxID=45954 RepID=A0A9D4IFW6_DREPO|nr:hypothetical protein DPMN_171780 [Dreissena polymorpha]
MKNEIAAMETNEAFHSGRLLVPRKNHMAFKINYLPSKKHLKETSVEFEMPAGSSSETVGTQSSYSQVSNRNGVKRGNGNAKYGGTEAWWNAGDFLPPEVSSPRSEGLFDKTNDDDTWDLSDSIVDLYKEVNKYDGVLNQSPTGRSSTAVNVHEWIQEDTNNGFVHVFKSDTDTNPRMFPCTLTTTAQRLCIQCGMPPNSLHVQLNGDIIRRLEPFDSPLVIQNEYLQCIGYSDQRKIQEIGGMEDLQYLVKFYAGKPVSDSTYSRNQLTTFVYVRKGKLLYQWVRRLCVISGTRLLIYRDKTKSGNPTVVQLAKGSIDEVKNIKGHDHVLKLTSTLQGERSVYLSFTDEKDYNKWIRKTKKATAKLPTKADLSNCHLEFLPETVFINDGLEILNLRHNRLKARPIEEDIYTIGWLDDLPRFTNLRSLNLADNSLDCFPLAVCKMRTLMELNLASNKIEDVPPTIVDLENLQILHLHNNFLSGLPDEMCRMRHLLVLVLAFNRFSSIPSVLHQSNESSLRIDSLIMAGNRIEKLTPEVLNKIQHIKKIDFRLNKLTLPPSEMAKFHLLELVTHLDVRDNSITDLDVRSLRNLEYLNCERNKIQSLQMSGSAIKTVLAMKNELTSFTVSPKPEWLGSLDLSHNRLEGLPVWISDCFFLVHLNASHNQIKSIPERLFCDTPKLKVLQMSHNSLRELPSEIGNSVLEEISLEHNQIWQLPQEFFVSLPKLRYICLTNNALEMVPKPNATGYQNKLQELYLSANRLDNNVIAIIAMFQKLKILHLAYNQITEIHDRDLRKLESLQELNISGNFLRHLPKCLGRHGKLQALRSNANLIKELPDFRYSPNLKVLEVGSNRLMDVSVTNLMASNVNLLDISGNPEMQVSSTELRGIKLSVSIVNRPKFNEGQEGMFALFDGGRNDEVTRILANQITALLEEETKHPITSQDYLKYTLLAAHRKLKGTGQKIGAAAAICHIQKPSSETPSYTLTVANVGDIEVVVCRRGEAVVMSRLFTVDANKDEMERICRTGGIVTEDNKINGVTHNTRLLGSSYLFPFVVPEPHVIKTTLQPDDTLLIIANQGLWKCMSYQETVNEIIDIPDPVLAAKKLQDLAQGYRSQENIGVLVVRLMLSRSERDRIKGKLQEQFEQEQKLLVDLKVRDIEREEMKRRAELQEQTEKMPMDIVKLKGAKKRKQLEKVFNGKDVPHDENGLDRVTVKPLPDSIAIPNVDPTTNWEILLQKRLTEEVKDKELIHAMRAQHEYDPYLPSVESDDNWSTSTKLKGELKGRMVTLPPNDDFNRFSKQPPPTSVQRRQIIPEASQISTESLEFKRELKHPLNVDRDAVLFHNMQLERHKHLNLSSRSIDSIQSDPSHASNRQIVQKERKSSSHSIEVLLHGPTAQSKQLSFGGSHKFANEEMNAPEKNVDSCPIDINEKLRMLEEKGFLSRHANSPQTKSQNGGRKISMEEMAATRKESNQETRQEIQIDEKSGETDDFDYFELLDDYETIEAISEDVDKEVGLTSPETHDVPNKKKAGERIPIFEDFVQNGDHSDALYAKIRKEKKPTTVDRTELTQSVTRENTKISDSDTYKNQMQKDLSKKGTNHDTNRKPNNNDFHRQLKEADKVVMPHSQKAKHAAHPPSPPPKQREEIANKNCDTSNSVSSVANVRSITPRAGITKLNVNVSNVASERGQETVFNKTENFKTAINPALSIQTNSNSSNKHQEVWNNEKTTNGTSNLETDGKGETIAPPLPPRVPLKPNTTVQSDINSNSIKSLEDLIMYNRQHQQQQKMSYKVIPKEAPEPPPKKVLESTMVTKTASQRSIIITYL